MAEYAGRIVAGLTLAGAVLAACGSSDSTAPAPAPTTTGATVKIGEACTRDGELRCGSGADGTHDGSVLFCTGGAYQSVFSCPGLADCTELATKTGVRCGTGTTYIDYAKDGAPCGAEGAVVCSFDKSAIEWCVDGKWVEAQHCPPSECTGLVDSTTGQRGMGCASGGITAGDMCKTDQAGAVTCSTDLKSLLGCKDGRAVVVETCTAPKVCSLTPTGRGCF